MIRAMSKEGTRFVGVELGLEDENALLRASLAEAQGRLQAIEEAADADSLTGLPNRRPFLRGVERLVGQAERHGTPAALVSIGLKGLASVNDDYGRLAGDSAVIHVGRLLAGLIRSTDMVARIGGDVFGLLLDHLDHNSAIETAERLGRCIAASPIDLGGTQVSVQAEIAVTGILPGDNVEDVIERSERNLERARSGC
jgi:diguanylate cyclase (GGDEF)-like protein